MGIEVVTSSQGWMLVTTTLPSFDVIAMTAAISSPRPTPLVRMTLLHMRPQVSCWISSKASSTVLAVWVAPNFWAVSRLNSTGSMAKIRSAPARRAPCTAADPSPPTPTTATLSPGRTSAA